MLLLMLLLALPERVSLKTPTETFTATHEVALRDGVLWWRRHGQPWTLLPPDGLPAPRGRLEALKELTAELPALPRPFRRPARIESISADGDNLIAVGPDGAVYYAKLSTLEWTDEWGPTGLKAPLSVKEAGAEVLSLALPFHDGLELGGRYSEALLLPAGKTPWLSKLRVLALGRAYLEVELEVTKEEVHLIKLPLIDLRFPR